MIGPFTGDPRPAWKRSGLSVLRCFLLLMFLASFLGPLPTARAQSQVPFSKVQGVLASMTAEERVGQLFLVTFQGTNTEPDSQIYDLIANHHVGGVVLLAGNDNFVAAPDTVTSAHQLVNSLQSIEAQVTTPTPVPNPNIKDGSKIYVPLFIGISQEGDGAPHDQILSGMTPLPDEMAIGATWKTEMSQQVGEVLGSELSALGFNLLLGPSLDVVESPNPAAQIDLGTRSFGGDPFWVGEMGKAYIAGLHRGSNSRMVVVAKHFPGSGSSDRSPEEEVATVRKSLEQLKQIELPPFFSVTNAVDPESLVDGVLVSHIRYQGFQGNIRATTRPVSLDASALSAIIALPDFKNWRTNGGLVVSDALGSQAVRAFYAQSGENFSPRVVARDAFVAGSDLLYLGNIASGDGSDDTYSATLRILDFFTQEYKSDQAFAQRVDAAVTRILAQKFRMYDLFTASNVLTSDAGLATMGASQQVMFDVARNAATLISPDPQALNTLLPTSPNQNDRIVFLTDTSSYQQCGGCVPQDALGTFAFQDTVERLYGPEGSAQIFASRLNSFPLSELELMLNGESKENIEPSLERANWIVISLTDVSKGQISLLRRFFTERPNLVRDKKVILFSFTAPYYLDATDISKLTAYYALYSKQPAFIEVAARVLFQQIIPLPAASPVSIPAVGYDLITATSPDPAQVIPLSWGEEEQVPLTPTVELTPVTVEPTDVPLYRIGDTIAVRAGPIFDHNHRLVPDNTPVRFTMSMRDESGSILKPIESVTTGGIARASFVIDRAGEVQISAASEPAVVSQVLQFDASNQGSAVTVVVPTVSVTPIIIVPTVNTPVPQNDLISPDGHPRLGVWLISLLALFGGAILGYWAVSRIITPRWGLRWALCIFLGGLLGYNYLALDMPGAANWIASGGGALGVLLLIFAGEALGMLGAWGWMRSVNEPTSRAN
ncbi:MAG TPA: glycoside hydrolase family 3 N-terminal domain-containing protein [Anaerolineales bacterium]|nr:glycoside hydrolase family 3 N-terminal domain-containing protein [Anaerolineales bacterium]